MKLALVLSSQLYAIFGNIFVYIVISAKCHAMEEQKWGRPRPPKVRRVSCTEQSSCLFVCSDNDEQTNKLLQALPALSGARSTPLSVPCREHSQCPKCDLRPVSLLLSQRWSHILLLLYSLITDKKPNGPPLAPAIISPCRYGHFQTI